jgi:hypothetical protein
MDIDLKKVTFTSPHASLSEGNSEIFYDGVNIGNYSRVNGNYPARVHGLNGESGSFASPGEAVKFLLASKNSVAISINLFPENTYILRVHEVMVTKDPVPGAVIKITAKIHYNTKNSTGSSAASKPTGSEMVEIDLDNEIIETKKNIHFANKKEIILKLKEALKEKL